MTTNRTTIAGFELTVRDLDRAVDFYTRALGLGVRAREDHDHFQEVQLVGDGDKAALLLVSPRAASPAAPSPSEATKVALLTDDVRRLFAEGLEAGAQAVLAPQHHAPLDVWYAHIRDPDGHMLQLIQRREGIEASTEVTTSPVDE